MKSNKCKRCKKYLGESFRDFPEGTIDDGTNLWCNQKCYEEDIKDPLDKIFVDYHKSIVKEKDSQWEFKKINCNFFNWLNYGANFSKHEECLDDKFTIGKDKKPNHITDFGRGYNQAISDIWKELKIDWKRFDKRTKTGFAKND